LSSPSPSKAQDRSIEQSPETRPAPRARQRRGPLYEAVKSVAKLLVPPRVLQEVAQYRKYKREERPLYLRIRMRDALGRRNNKRLARPSRARSFLFVCSGNIMRSPMCEALMKQEMMRQQLTAQPRASLTVTSAGLNATPGRQAHPWSIASATPFGISLESHFARPLTEEMVNQADVIFAMDYQNEVELLSRYPQAEDKVYMLSGYAGDGYRTVEIRDPYYGDEEETRRCYGILQTCIHNLVSTLTPPPPQSGDVAHGTRK
jgi:protein-tyrosine phosphatase